MPQGKIWRRNEELSFGYVAKGAHTGSGGRVIELFVTISYSKGIVFCSEYDKCHGDYFADFIESFPKCLGEVERAIRNYLYKIIAQYRTVLKRIGLWLL